MSTIKSSDEHLTLNADGSSKDIKFQANGVEKASISSSGAFTSTTIDATKLTGNLPAVNGSALTNLTAANLTGALPAISGAALTNLPSGGKVLQVVSMYTDTSTGSSVGDWHATSVTASITPSATSSKILVSFDGQLYAQNTASDGGMAIKIQQAISGGTTSVPDALHSRSTANYSAYYTSDANGQFAFRAPLSGLVSPNTTSAITYTLYFIPYAGTNSAGINNMNGRSTLTLMEIAG